jgi:signal peptidase I
MPAEKRNNRISANDFAIMDKQSRPAAAEKPKKASQPGPSMARTIRETVESIVIAFALAFLFRTFEAEAFVIPTGSMAPTLQGRHKDVVCPECSYQYRVGVQTDQEEREKLHLQESVCPMCRFKLDLAAKINEDPKTYQTFEGDRILVNKFSYDLGEPKRWDVVVFKFPEDAKTNYIKRLVGLPGEHVYIGDPGRGMPPGGTGDIYISTDGGKTRQIARKETPEKLLAMLQDVHDNDYVPARLLENGWPARWQAAEPSPVAGWKAENGTREFVCDGEQGRELWLRYRHLLPPSPGSWRDPENAEYTTALIRDFYAYNSERENNAAGENWVGDLAMECEAEIRSDSGELVLELVKGGRTFQARIDVASGDARLVIPGLEEYKPVAVGVIDGPGTYQLRLANVDEQLWLFVDDELVQFDMATTYESLGNYTEVTDPVRSPLGATDDSPAGIASVGADVRLSHLRIKRDVFYTRDHDNAPDPISEIQLVDDPVDDQKDQFFMLGDNSPSSKDGRLWGPFEAVDYVERRLLIGKAVYIYWPHSWPAKYSIPLKLRSWRIDIPFWPNFERMERIR